ncbi:hypothetical protein [Tomitella gaofuii]|uniref:hypothetical protein n=1 Tax=Tomitella gaofuii TaxID=2760083 RepID=UPI0015F7D175|nr:hypothetical protein [Tomitella gaofuii]
MSKPRGNTITTITLSMTADETAVVICKAPTYSRRRITFDPVGWPGVCLVAISVAMVKETAYYQARRLLGYIRPTFPECYG